MILHDSSHTDASDPIEGWSEENKKALEEALRRFETAVETIKIAITISDTSGRILYSNPADAQLHGYDRQEIIGKDARIFAPPEFWNPMKMEKLTEMTTWKREALNIRKDGTVFPVELTSEALISPSGEIIGVITTCEDITERKQRERELARRAMYDSLTDLANRSLFLDRLEQTHKHWQRTKQPFAVLFLDLDHFKRINDTYGHLAGDELLEKLAQRLVSCLRPGDTVGRLGGDEFAILLERVRNQKEAISIASRIQSKLKPPYLISSQEITITASIGIAINAEESHTFDEVLRRSDAAMYRAKARGRNRHQIFDGIMISTPGETSAGVPYPTHCLSCKEAYDATKAKWCRCISIERTLVCPSCECCFCKSSLEYKETFWASAPEILWHQKATEHGRSPGFRSLPELWEVKRPLVLIGQHNRLLQKFILDAVETMGYGTLQAEDGQHVLNLANQYLPELVFTDVLLPKVDGRELCRRVKSYQATAHIKVILVINSYSHSRQQKEMTSYHPDEYLKMPISFAELQNILAKHLR